MRRQIVIVTGTDTGIGKTVVTCALTALLHGNGEEVVALKPICSGGRDDARLLRKAAGTQVPLDAVNPWHFRAALAPVVAARQEGRRVTLSEVIRHIRRVQETFANIVIESAGGLLSPLGDDFDTRDLIRALRARPVVVAPNRLGAVNQVRLVLEALPRGQRRSAHVVLVRHPGARGAATNVGLLSEFFPPSQIHEMPWLGFDVKAYASKSARALSELVAALSAHHP